MVRRVVQATLALTAGLVVLAVALFLVNRQVTTAWSVARYIAAQGLLVSGAVWLGCLFWTRDVAFLRRGAALCLLGIGLQVRSAALPWSPDGVHIDPTAGAVRLLLLATALAILNSHSSQTRGTFGRRSVLALCVVIGAAGLISLTTRSLPCTAIGEAAACWGWFALATQSARARSGAPWATPLLTAGAFAVLTLGEAIRLCTLFLPVSVLSVDPDVRIVAALMLIGAALGDLLGSWRHEHDRSRALVGQLALTRSRLDDLHTAEAQRLHDARSAAAGLAGASQLLTRAELADTDRTHLAGMIDAELARLMTMLDRPATEACVPFDLAEAVDGVMTVARLAAPNTRAELAPVPVLGRPHATATALDNVLRNARHHAPGAPVHVWTRRRGTAVDLVVDDAGPGVPEADRERLLRAGERGGRSTGSGLGLHIAATAVAEQGGALTLDTSPAGGLRVVLTLPAADPAPGRPGHVERAAG